MALFTQTIQEWDSEGIKEASFIVKNLFTEKKHNLTIAGVFIA